jgi:hypothetical protein
VGCERARFQFCGDFLRFCDAANKKQPDALRFSGEKHFLTVYVDLVRSNDGGEPRGKVIHNGSFNNRLITGFLPPCLIAGSGIR